MALGSHRLLQQGSFAEALSEFAGLGSVAGEEFFEGIGGNLQAASMAVSGAEFLRFSRHLQEKAAPFSTLARLSGVITRVDGPVLFISDDAGRPFRADKGDYTQPIWYFAKNNRVTFIGGHGRCPGRFRAKDVRRET